ncbi:replication initiator protein [Blackfly microvirus SF02]|uniref:Replication initiator protein n=1 Tax=Blackfly microvirus SF02 TaxID=2576452 RepID=A0A4V1F5E9_9VIRU|nr:replication initiator protein [Blackfly microvirus SF02]
MASLGALLPCYHPLRAYRGDRGVSFAERKGHDQPIDLPCGRCIGCRIKRSQAWAIRCVHEAQLHPANCVITLTYDEENLSSTNLNHRDFQLFLKRLRKRYTGHTIRYFMCGEYGDINLRPHFHSCLFGIHFPDRKTYSKNKQGQYVFSSPTLAALWPQGQTTVMPLNLTTAGYCARYFFKENKTAKALGLSPEYNRCSLKPGLGHEWFHKYANTDVYPGDYIVNDKGQKLPVPAYYDKLFKRYGVLDKLKEQREQKALPYKSDNTVERLRVKETVKLAAIQQLTRDL